MSSTSSLDSPAKKRGIAINESAVGEKAYTGEAIYDYHGEFTPEQLELISEHLDDRSIEECLAIIREAIEYHDDDPSLELAYHKSLNELPQGPRENETQPEWEYRIKFEAFLIHDWSIYPAVRSVTVPFDEEEESDDYENIRVYLISIIWSCSGSVLATFFATRFPGISMGGLALQILIAYTGKLFSFIPGFSFPIGFGRRISFGSGKWTFKEQMLATCGMGAGNTSPYSQSVVIVMANQYFYNFKEAQGNFGFTVLLTLATNLMGFGFAGLFRVFLVYPTRMVWWGLLPTIRISRTLIQPEVKETTNGWKIKGIWVFWIATLINFCWYWIVDYVFPFLSEFDWMSWINPKDNNLITICGTAGYGLGFNPVPSLDPNMSGPSAMITPFFITINTIVGLILGMLVVIGIYYQNISWTSYIQINTNTLYNRFGSAYNVSEVLDSRNNLDKEKYMEYGMPFWSAGNLVSYGSFFAFYPALIVYSILEYGNSLVYSGKVFWSVLKNPKGAMNNYNDRFSRAQRKYREVPEWWYISFLCICLGLGIATVEHYKFTNTPVWTIFFGVGLSGVFMIPCGILYAVTNTQVIINVLYELVIGLTVPGNGYALMVSKAFATNFMVETDSFVTTLKMGHYTGIAPRAMFRAQIINCLCNSFVQAGLITWQSEPDSIKNMCSTANRNTNKFTCNTQRIYFNAAVQWGTIGPKRVLRDLYTGMRYTFLFGALYPLPFYFLRHYMLAYARRHKLGNIKEGASKFRNNRFIRSILSMEWATSINEIVILSGCISWGSQNAMYTIPTLYWGFIFAYLIPRYFPKWWARYNYLIYAGIQVGISYAGLICFFATSYKHIPNFDWWGNDAAVTLDTYPRLDASALPDGFGPTTWKW